jgi:Tfp pilus assembly protein PilN
MATKHNINLLQSEIFPEKPLLTLPKVVGIWLVLLMFMLAWTIVTEVNYKKSNAKYYGFLTEQEKQKKRSQVLESQLQSRQITPALMNKLNTLKLVMQHKQALLDKLTNTNETFAGGFVMVMNDLSAMHNKDIRLQTISINANDMSFTGLARNPQAVPAWLSGFKTSKLLSGKEFLQFKLISNEQNITEFVVSSIVKKDKIE